MISVAKTRKYDDDANTAVVVLILLIGIAYGIQQGQAGLVWFCILLLVIIAIIIFAIIFIRRHQNSRLRRSNIKDIDKMSGLEFEKFVRLLLIDRGYRNVQLTGKYDLGIDIIASKDDEIWGIQVKRYKKPVGLDAIRQAVTALKHYHCTRAMVITNNNFTKNAKIIASTVNCVLVNRDELINLILSNQIKYKK